MEQILQSVLGDGFKTAGKQGICPCTTLDRDEIVAEISAKGLTTTKEVMHVLNFSNPEGCSKCRPAIHYYLAMLNPVTHQEKGNPASSTSG